MNCKYCDALLEDGVTVCSICGKDLTEETAAEPEMVEEAVVEETAEELQAGEAAVEETTEETDEIKELVEEEFESETVKKQPIAWWKAALMGAGVMLVVILCALAILRSQNINPMDWFTSKESTTQSDYESKYPLKRDSYTASEKNVDAQAAQVVAKCGDDEITNAQLQIYYWNGVYEFINNYQYYLESIGLDLNTPFDQQDAMVGTTWQKFFLENALFNWHKFSALAQEAERNGFTLSATSQEQIDNLASQLEEIAQSNSYASAAEMLEKEMGALVNVESYVEYSRVYYLAMEYFNAQYDALMPTEQQIEDYFVQHEEELAASGITKDSKTYNVRHILLEPKDGTEDSTTGLMNYTDEAWEACLKEAEAMLEQWKTTDGTEDGFAELAKNNSADGGSSTNGGMYTDLDASTNFVEEFKNWYLDESRQVGDTGIVKSVYGYHIMYLSAANTNWQSQCQSALITELSESLVQNVMEAYKVEINDKKIAIGHVTFQIAQ